MQTQKALTFHNELAVVPELVLELLQRVQPFAFPFFRAIAPCTRPLAVTPRVAHNDEALSPALTHAHDGICVSRKQSLHVEVGTLAVRLVKIEGYAKESRVKFVMLQLLMPKFVFTE